MTAVILAGGQSRRMEQNKAWLEIGGRPVIQRVLSQVAPLFEEIIIAGDSSPDLQNLGVKIVSDKFKGKGPLAGLYTGLITSRSEWIFCCACDMPFLNKKLLLALKGQASRVDTVICQWEGRLQPLHGFYRQTCLPVIEKHLREDSLKLVDIFPSLEVKYLKDTFVKRFDQKGHSFFNLNTPDAISRANIIAGGNKLTG